MSIHRQGLLAWQNWEQLWATRSLYIQPSLVTRTVWVFIPSRSNLYTSALANSSVDLRHRATPAPAQDSPGSVVTDSTGAPTPNSPRTPSTPSWPSRSLSQNASPKNESRDFAIGAEGRGQCTGPRDQDCVGDQVSMSQRGPGPRPASRRSSISSVRNDQGSSAHYAPQSGSGDVRYESAGVTSTDLSRMGQQLPPKSLGVHNILNPSEPRPMSSEAGGRPSSRSRESDGTLSGPSSTPYGAPRPIYPGHAATHSLPATPVTAGVTPFGRPPMSERNSPVTNYPAFSSLNNPRKVLSPRPPRAMSISHPGPPRDFDPRQQQSLVPNSMPAKRPYEADTADEPRLPPGLHQPPGMSARTHTPMVTPPRSISQPLARPLDAPHITPPTIPPPGDLQGRSQVLHAPLQFQHGAPPAPPSRPMSRMESPTEGSSLWPEMLRRQGFSGVEPQQAFMTLPGSDTPIPVQVDYSQASKKADEKRQRNAKASTRHRRKKKTLQEENMKQLQDLKDERQQMMQQMDDIIQQRDFYRDERNRLRDVVARTPSISNHAAGPPSPVSTKSVGSLGDRSPITQQHIPTPNQGYSSEGSSIDRPIQRRRTEERPEFSTPVYASQSGAMQHGLPSVHSQAYGIPPRPPSAASSASGERLPPLRAMEGHASSGQGLPSGQPQEQDLRTGQWRAAQSTHYETGWATSRKPHDTHQWQ
ncbi:hypothetical protein PT974_08208 [Cladobotryum mycophilum]|uniref:BZIP domain-containing protein n=1 Tax=Cladobotryum mycophilum TaxID=491253 RepID=A0ABR0SDV5_9HYPO